MFLSDYSNMLYDRLYCAEANDEKIDDNDNDDDEGIREIDRISEWFIG
jgi:hypothetical protein